MPALAIFLIITRVQSHVINPSYNNDNLGPRNEIKPRQDSFFSEFERGGDGADESYPYSWSGMLELGRSNYGACLSDEADKGGITLQDCQCNTGDCRKDDGINHPTIPFRWNFRGTVNLNKRAAKRPSYFTGYIQNAGSKLCMTYLVPAVRPVPFNEEMKIGDIVMRECGTNSSSTVQQFSTWIFDGRPMSQIQPTYQTHFVPSCNNNEKMTKFFYRGLVGIKGKPIFYGCTSQDQVDWNYHPWFYRTLPEQSFWPDDRWLDDLSDRIVDFDFENPAPPPPPPVTEAPPDPPVSVAPPPPPANTEMPSAPIVVPTPVPTDAPAPPAPEDDKKDEKDEKKDEKT
ncbi:hypothetical protein TWF481_007636 [Arthrobotrys musiformis]|uniref:Uncharacterized protein n=1 Tax=Arthrobotrys musiformis TaxID=47236 RepID=A0AAV9WC19_9PEZI